MQFYDKRLEDYVTNEFIIVRSWQWQGWLPQICKYLGIAVIA